MESGRKWTRSEVEAHNTQQSAHIIIDNRVYDVTEFLMEHPGGIEVLIDNAGKDASRCFAEVGHSELAIDWRDKFLVGELVPEEHRPVERRPVPQDLPPEDRVSALIGACTPPLMLALFAMILYLFLFQ